MSEISIDRDLFFRRVGIIQSKLAAPSTPENPNEFYGADSVLIVTGKFNEDNLYLKSSVLHTWILGYEFPATALLITRKQVVVVTSAGKAKHLSPLLAESNPVPVIVWTRTKDASHNKSLFENLLNEILAAGPIVGKLPKDQFEGAFVDEWQAVYSTASPAPTEIDATLGLSACENSHRDETELALLKTAAKASTAIMTQYFAEEMSTIIDDERTVTHAKFSDRIEAKIEDTKFFTHNAKVLKSLGGASNFDASLLDWSYTPIVQSGGAYDLRPSAQSDNKPLQGDVILCSLGIRYKFYCSNIARTYLIDPTKDQEANYMFLVQLQQHLLDTLREGLKVQDLYAAAIQYIKQHKPALVNHFLKNIGWGIGIDFKDSTMLLNAKNSRTFQPGMTLNLSVGFADLPNSNNKSTYSLLLTDTVQVAAGANTPPIVLTDSAKGKDEISYYFKDDDNADIKAEETKQAKSKAKSAKIEGSSTILRSKLRGEARNHEDDTEQKRVQHQKLLHSRIQQEGLKRFTEEGQSLEGDAKPLVKKFESYKREEQIPSYVKDLRIHVDVKTQTILVPINGRPVPFHISSYRNGSKNEEGDWVYIRLNFHSPGQVASKKENTPFQDANAEFIRNITLRSRDGERMADVFKKITDLKKEAVKREAERKEMADVIEQDNLVQVKNRRPIKLDSVFMRPATEGKRVPGGLEIHQNGIRYVSPFRSDQNVDVVFSNIKHLFFQPCDQELIVVIHLHLKNPIMIGKRKTKDVQFYREASEMAFDETGNRRRKYRYGDEDELEAEQEERRRRVALNKEFRGFTDKISEASNGALDVDIPFRELGFSGVPFRSNVLCQPTTDCLVQFIDPPFLVVTLQEIEIAHLERVQFGLKNFDLVFVYKDFNRPVTHINTIPMESLDSVKDWLNEVDIPFSEGPVNLNWPTIMKTVTGDPHSFFAEGGWNFLTLDSDNEDDAEEEESEFEVSDDNPDDESGEESDDYSEDGGASDDDGSSFDEDEESGEDWDALDEKARRADAGLESEDEEKGNKRRKRA
ncbi:SPT16-domain-containing protein [Nadsonia fulvescens var. elongata DSM 6958]|uniref:FACT complex subunit n=1 Tax=Nadsonia fulvescens var. elongata DSM 6958 TaxID=857566 RepID=A0A1E3PEE3_9ASCO|nr:SPT16-domain-containing protein [Nadsonia fulvescens var. elongata DSM 6958]